MNWKFLFITSYKYLKLYKKKNVNNFLYKKMSDENYFNKTIFEDFWGEDRQNLHLNIYFS